MDLAFSILQGFALAGLLIGLGWIIWEQAVHPIEPSSGAREPQRLFVLPDHRDGLIVVAPPAAVKTVETAETDSKVVVPDVFVPEDTPRLDRGVVTGLQ